MPTEEPNLSTRVEFAWRCHASQENWASKVDTKASILLSGNLVGLAALLSTRADAVTNPGSAGGEGFGVGLGIVILGVAAIVTAAVIFPMLGPRRASTPGDIVYFGHLRDRKPAEVLDRLVALSTPEQLGQLARQLVAMARINWLKHRMLQAAMVLSLVGYVVVGAVLLA
ncbi:hypothetical protein GA0074695_4487 [Micromonospora viridifaciens]|uniref:Pycsar effector protein domain-containing protein n=1 Tax=Micromonospora viridifaciens TaxID=1881 RepID=A0A1C4YNG9_MICVI|nr:Pycsar system effector family protein [Micromonospora viridifaciens]SCF22187.1 hypothetical protein GA0074695_4487 [Micromonospora viridifaciens]